MNNAARAVNQLTESINSVVINDGTSTKLEQIRMI